MSTNKYIDHVFYINLDKRADRRQEIEAELAKYDIYAERFSAIETPNQGIVGCGLSHTAVLRLAKERGYRNVLILEDDFEFLVSKEEWEAQLMAIPSNGALVHHLTENAIYASSEDFTPPEKTLTHLFWEKDAPEFDVCMLSYNLHKSEPLSPPNPVLGRVKYAQTASGYIVNAHYYDTIIQLYEWAIPLLQQTGQHWVYANDVVWRQLQERDTWVYFLERIGRQRAGYSDNAQSFQNHGC